MKQDKQEKRDKAVVLGMGSSGKAASYYLKDQGYEVIELDGSEEVDWEGANLFVPSPGIPRTHPLYLEALEKGVEIAGEMELGLRACKKRCIGITGSNGKSTVCALIAHLLNFVGIKAEAVGNFGKPLLEAIQGEAEVLVVEISSFQLETIKTGIFEAVALLNIAPNHLDRYASFEEYASFKKRILSLTKPGGRAIYPAEKMEAVHFLMAALNIDEKRYREGIETFSGLPYRMEEVGKVEGVTYINDSKSTSVASTIFAVESISDPTILLLGGKNKGLSFEPLKSYTFKQVIAFGDAATEIAACLTGAKRVKTVEEAVALAKTLAAPGDVVLFSPGCTSFDHFDNYSHRGQEFNQAVSGGKTVCLEKTPS